MLTYKSWQFDQNKEYPPHAWCQGPGAFFASTQRGHVRLAKNDWIVEFDNGEVVVMGHDTYTNFIEPAAEKTDVEPLPPSEAPAPVIEEPVITDEPAPHPDLLTPQTEAEVVEPDPDSPKSKKSGKGK